MSHRKFQWTGLDTAAKIFPCTSGQRDTKVFRFVCELKEPVQPQKLQEALDQTLDSFPGFQTIIKRGLFWYYLEDTDKMPVVQREYKSPCSQLYDKDVSNLLFEVTYFGCRVNLEVFHAISDGTGAMHFLRVLIFRYLKRVHPEALGGLSGLDYDASESQSMDDSFARYANYQKLPKIKKVHKTVYRLRGMRTMDYRLNVIVGTVPTKQLLNVSHSYGTSLTELICALVILAIRKEMPVKDVSRPIVLAVPINLRNHFRSASARNFFGVMDVGYDFSQGDGSLKSILAKLDQQFKAGLSPEELQYRVNQYIMLIENPLARAMILSVKDGVMRLGSYLETRKETSAVSNIGIVHMPAELRPYIEKFEVFISTQKVQMCCLTYEEKMTLSFSSAFLNTEIQKNFFRSLTNMGIPVEIDTDFFEDN
jgi:hypothetical protein